MANINDIESLFSLIDQSPNDYKEFYHEKNGLHALDKWSYLKNIQLENPTEEGISIFENRPKSNEGSLLNVPIAVPDESVAPKESLATVRTVISPLQSMVASDFVVTPPTPTKSFNSPVIDTKIEIPPVAELKEVSSKFEEPEEEFEAEPLESSQPIEPLTPQVYNPTVTAPATPKVFTTTDIPSVPSFSPKFTSNVNPTTATTFTSGFIRPTTTGSPAAATPAATPTTQPSFLPPRFTQAGGATKVETAEQANDQTTNPLNTIFSRLEQK